MFTIFYNGSRYENQFISQVNGFCKSYINFLNIVIAFFLREIMEDMDIDIHISIYEYFTLKYEYI